MRRLDREIEALSRASTRAKLALLSKDAEQGEVRLISYWEAEEWASTYVLSASESRKPLPGKWWALCFVEFGNLDPDEFLRSDDTEGKGPTPPISDAREIRRLLEVPGVEDRPELCGLLVALGLRRDEMDVPALLGFAGHEDPIVRYVCLGMLSWQPSVTNDMLGHRFRNDPDTRVADLAARFGTGRTGRKTRA